MMRSREVHAFTLRARNLSVLAIVATGALALVACQPLKKAAPPPPPPPLQTFTQTFDCIEASQTWTVPARTTQATFELLGGEGGVGHTSAPATGGRGAGTTATIPVTPGDVLQINVGCEGLDAANGSAGGYGGAGPAPGDAAGGDGGTGSSYAGGGGGASDVRQGGTELEDRVLVAGGGGGSGGSQVGGGAGGGASGDDGGNGTAGG